MKVSNSANISQESEKLCTNAYGQMLRCVAWRGRCALGFGIIRYNNTKKHVLFGTIFSLVFLTTISIKFN